jgi:uncharacterized repeat protein (TIGR03803 family)
MVVLPSLAFASTSFETSWKFSSVANGDTPYDAVVSDAAGVLYGTTTKGGPTNQGVVFALTPPLVGGDSWTESTLWTFSGADGANPFAALTIGAAGTLYGTTAGGGKALDGTVFALTPPLPGQTAWTEQVLWSFAGGSDGANPYGTLIADGGGALYGTTEFGGKVTTFCKEGCGTVFKLTPPAPGQTSWTKTTVWKFSGNDGYYPYAGVIAGSDGTLYGTTVYNMLGYGTVYSLKPPALPGGAWSEKTIFMFPIDLSSGANPYAGLLMTPAGALYGVTAVGGFNGGGVAFTLAPPAPGQTQWTHSTIANLMEKSRGSLVADATGALYGTGLSATGDAMGTIFKLTPPPPGQQTWTETSIWHFMGGGGGAHPYSGLLEDVTGTLYGTTANGSGGTVFTIDP